MMDREESMTGQPAGPVSLFPEFEKYARETGLMAKAEGSLSAKLPRILGQGQTKAVGLDMPPAPIERKIELSRLEFPANIELPDSVRLEISRIKEEVEQELASLKSEDGIRRLCAKVMPELPDTKGVNNNRYFSGRLVLSYDSKGGNYSWGITVHHPVISKIPPDAYYMIKAHTEAEKMLSDLSIPPDQFSRRLRLAWKLAEHFSLSDEVLISDVARMYLVAGQDDRFWNSPGRRSFSDLPPAAFVANLLVWRRSPDVERDGFSFVPATLSQEKRAFYLPSNAEGTQTKPYIFMRRGQ